MIEVFECECEEVDEDLLLLLIFELAKLVDWVVGGYYRRYNRRLLV